MIKVHNIYIHIFHHILVHQEKRHKKKINLFYNHKILSSTIAPININGIEVLLNKIYNVDRCNFNMKCKVSHFRGLPGIPSGA